MNNLNYIFGYPSEIFIEISKYKGIPIYKQLESLIL